ncbi:cobalamin-binding protein [Halomonas sp. MCCC 1A17488]|uniref:Cobalamin-binding protein n=1 Tax=Billgrantia sulfidoxydans TaxID=2733484 RepID=A0ABX7WBR2_9GAMM|nr:cobalamin-binding protein [Halomonas sp. MCCC 1A17488]MCG3240376.1 cobalamin-binding protein [Halomonas sp. MCCC 1A17488]QPP51469.1 cobalamin-binding protein [Halomonas sp. SS10-MC5]QTP56927.1 cobalamin-binding protein [Halomonas sulfidoxydans]
MTTSTPVVRPSSVSTLASSGRFGGAVGPAVGFSALLALSGPAAGEAYADSLCATDDRDREVCLPVPAGRIAALSPGATELVYAAGAGDQVVAVVDYSDYPPQAQAVPSLGSHTRIDMERLVALRPTLVIGWVTGNPSEQLEMLEALGLPVFYLEPRSFEGVASAIERLGRLAGTADAADREARRFRDGMIELRERYAGRAPVRVFYQVWDEPLMTVNDAHLIGSVLTACGGVNVFGDLERLVPRIGDESVLDADPEAILAGGMGEESREWLTHWEQYTNLTAVAEGNLFFVPPSLIQRPTPRLLEGSRLFCEKLEAARARR